jgi:hypothetical protein
VRPSLLRGPRVPGPGRGRAALVAGALLAAGCTTDIRGQPEVAGAVVTYRAQGVDFGSFTTFALASRVGLVTDTQQGKFFADAPALLAAVTSRLEASGLQKVADLDPSAPPAAPPAADLVATVTALDFAGSEGGFWVGFAGYTRPADLGLPGFDWAYPWPWVAVAFQPGTILVEVADLRDRTPGSGGPGQIEVVWAALAYGVAPGGAWDGAAALAALERAFDQSAYLSAPQVQP